MIRPVCSAIGTNSLGPTMPNSRVIPARERLDADDPARAQVGLRLVVELDLALVDRRSAGRRRAPGGAASGGRARARRSRGRGRTAWPSTSRCRRAAAASRCPRRARGAARCRCWRRSRARMPSSTNGSRRCASRLLGDDVGVARGGRRAGAGRRTRRRRGGRPCRSRAARRCRRRETSSSRQVAHVVAERVVDLLEVIEVHDHHHGGCSPLRRPARTACSMRSRNSSRFGQAGERVVQRLVLLGDRLAAAAVDGEDRQEEQQRSPAARNRRRARRSAPGRASGRWSRPGRTGRVAR